MFRSDHVALSVSSLARSRDFYVDLGGRVVSRPSPHFVEVMLGDLRLHLVAAKAGSHAPPAAGRVGIDHVCVNVTTMDELRVVRDRLNASPLLGEHAPFQIQESPTLGEGLQDHCEERPPMATLYAHDPDGIGLEIRCYG